VQQYLDLLRHVRQHGTPKSDRTGVGTLSGNGVTRETLRIGDHVVVLGNPGRNPEEHRLRLLSIERPSDGWTWKGSFE